jgi:alkylmercury lyase
MTTPTIADLTTTWTQRNAATRELSQAGIRLLADGKPVTAAMLADAAGIRIAEAQAYIESGERMGLEVEDGAVVGAALTLRPTQHRFAVRGNDLYTWCGFDALFLPIIIGEQAKVASTCPVTGTEIRLTVDPDGTVSDATPGTTVVAIVGSDVTSSCETTGPESQICTQMPFFSSREAGEKWLAEHPGIAIVDLGQAREIARASTEQCCC